MVDFIEGAWAHRDLERPGLEAGPFGVSSKFVEDPCAHLDFARPDFRLVALEGSLAVFNGSGSLQEVLSPSTGLRLLKPRPLRGIVDRSA